MFNDRIISTFHNTNISTILLISYTILPQICNTDEQFSFAQAIISGLHKEKEESLVDQTKSIFQ